MYFMYVDESGDNGKFGSPYFILSGLIIHSSKWNDFFKELKIFRQLLKDKYNFFITYELHARKLLRSSGLFQKTGLHLTTRTAVYKETIDFLSKQSNYLSLMVVCIKKGEKWKFKDSYAEKAWQLLIQRFDNFLYKNQKSYGIIMADSGYERLARKIYRRMRAYNPIPSKTNPNTFYNKPLKLVLEDPNFKDSRESFFIQLVDLACYAVKLEVDPTKRAKRKKYSDFFKVLDPIKMPKISKTKDGIVRCP